MAVDITGTRDGEEWPARGKVIDLPDDEANSYIYSGICEPAPDAETASDPVEADASDPVVVETAGDPAPAKAEKAAGRK
jgi:hypothetical protein